MDKKQEKEILQDLDDALKTPRKNQKMRITTLVDADVLDELKRRSKNLGIGYQTYLNELLRESLFGPNSSEKSEILELRDTLSDVLNRLEKVEKEKTG